MYVRSMSKGEVQTYYGYTGRISCEQEDNDWGDAFTLQGSPRLPAYILLSLSKIIIKKKKKNLIIEKRKKEFSG